MFFSKIANNESEALLSLFLFSMEPYHRLRKALPLNVGCTTGEGGARKNKQLESFEADAVALEMRLMLQRKYFQRGERLHFRKILKALKSSNEANGPNMIDPLKVIGEMEAMEIEIVAGNGEMRRGAHQNIEDSTYGFLLHADIDRAQRVASISDGSRVFALRDFVLKRETVLLLLETAVRNAGFLSLRDTVENDNHAVVRFSKTTNDDLGIIGSPKWSGLVGNDLNMEGIERYTSANDMMDNMAILAAGEFLRALSSCPLDVKGLRKRTAFWTWGRWGDFSRAADLYSTFRHPGCSSCVLHEGGEHWAQVKILEDVEDSFEIVTPQAIEGVCYVTLRLLFGKWKVIGFVDGRSRHLAGSR